MRSRFPAPSTVLLLLLAAATAVGVSATLRLPAVVSDELECFACETLLSALGSDVFSGNATEVKRKIQDGLDDLCTDAFGRDHPEALKRCDSVAAAIAKQFPEIARTLNASIYTSSAVCRIADICTETCCVSSTQPEQLRLAMTGNATTMAVSFVAAALYAKPQVRYSCHGSNKGTQVVAAQQHTYTHGGWRGNIYEALMVDLLPGARCQYTVGDASSGVVSDTVSFSALRTSPAAYSVSRPLRVLNIADMGNKNSAATLLDMKKLLDAGVFELVLHNGDISYADAVQTLWDEYLRAMEPISSRVPYMATPGNHEIPWDFGTYKARFGTLLAHTHATTGADVAPQPAMWWSTDVGPMHVIGLDTEAEADTPFVREEMVQWLVADLEKATQAEQRKRVPWIVVMAHRPLYCSTHGGFLGADCGVLAQYLREKLEDVFYKYGCDLVLGAHKHNYERSYPLYQGAIMNGGHYGNPGAPVYVVNGAAGNREGLQSFYHERPPWSAAAIKNFGYATFEVTPTTLAWRFYNDSATALRALTLPAHLAEETAADAFTITKTDSVGGL